MINAFASIQNYTGDNWEEYLNSIGLYDVFKEILISYPDSDDVKCIIRYIVWAYSVESDRIIIGRDWLQNKKEIFEAANVKPTQALYNDLVLLQNSAVISVVNKWLCHQDSDVFQQLSLLKDLRLEMQQASVSKILKATGEVDYKAKYDCSIYAIELKSKIKDLEAEMIQNNAMLKEAVKEIKVAGKRKETIGVENFSR